MDGLKTYYLQDQHNASRGEVQLTLDEFGAMGRVGTVWLHLEEPAQADESLTRAVVRTNKHFVYCKA